MLVGVGDPLVVFLFELVLFSVRIRVTAAPEFLDKTFALVVSRQFFECLPLFIGNDVGNVFVQPIFVGFLELRLYVARLGGGILLTLSKHAQAGAQGKNRDHGQTKSNFLVRHLRLLVTYESCDKTLSANVRRPRILRSRLKHSQDAESNRVSCHQNLQNVGSGCCSRFVENPRHKD